MAEPDEYYRHFDVEEIDASGKRLTYRSQFRAETIGVWFTADELASLRDGRAVERWIERDGRRITVRYLREVVEPE
jgi:hypothetical protein